RSLLCKPKCRVRTGRAAGGAPAGARLRAMRAERTPKAVWVAVGAQFGLAFSMNYLTVFLPFYIRSVSELPEAQTLVWTGLILAASPAAASIASPMWGSL